jgi:hypothetical protein
MGEEGPPKDAPHSAACMLAVEIPLYVTPFYVTPFEWSLVSLYETPSMELSPRHHYATLLYVAAAAEDGEYLF